MELAMMMEVLSKKEDRPKLKTDEESAEAKRKREEELRTRQGRGASMVSGGAGLTGEPTLGRTSLLGAA